MNGTTHGAIGGAATAPAAASARGPSVGWSRGWSVRRSPSAARARPRPAALRSPRRCNAGAHRRSADGCRREPTSRWRIRRASRSARAAAPRGRIDRQAGSTMGSLRIAPSVAPARLRAQDGAGGAEREAPYAREDGRAIGTAHASSLENSLAQGFPSLWNRVYFPPMKQGATPDRRVCFRMSGVVMKTHNS